MSVINPDDFHQCYSAKTTNGDEADNQVSDQLREFVWKLESLKEGNRVSGMRFVNGELMLALHTSYEFARIPKDTNLKDIDTIRMSFTESLYQMNMLLKQLQDSCSQL